VGSCYLAVNGRNAEWKWYVSNMGTGTGHRQDMDLTGYQICDRLITNTQTIGITYGSQFQFRGASAEVAKHLMVKGYIWKRNGKNGSARIGFWTGVGGWPTYGVGFAYSTALPLVFVNPNWYAVAATAVSTYVRDTGIPLSDTVPHKFNVIVRHTDADFYIDNVLTNNITKVAAGTSWPTAHDTYAEVFASSLQTIDPCMTIYWQWPIIAAQDFVTTGP
jgi:hypothetical protein